MPLHGRAVFEVIKIMSRRKKAVLIVLLVMAASIWAGGAWYVNDYYRADMEAIELFASEKSISAEVSDDNTIIFEPEEADTGLIFYPGGKVEYTAYMPLMQECAEQGILCVLVEMPFNLAVLDINAADGIQEQYPQITEWYIGGHSLGGSMAASYLEKNIDDFEGLILLGSYSTADLSETDLKVLSVYGSEDNVLNHEKYEKYKTNLPDNYDEVIIEGGCHAYFGMYGMQSGDGIPFITNEEQIVITADKVIEMIHIEL